jgi:cell division protein FtsZ
MDTPPDPAQSAEPVKKIPHVRIFGVGNAGANVAERLFDEEIPASCFVAVNTDPHALAACSAQVKVQVDDQGLSGLGTGGDPERGRALAEKHAGRLKDLCMGQDLIFILAGLGGGAGTGITPVLARLAKEAGALVLVFGILPFDCEGDRRCQCAQDGLEEIREIADAVICLPNQKALRLVDEATSAVHAFRFCNGLLADCARGIWRLVMHPGLIEIHFNQLCELLRERHSESVFAVAEAAGATRSREVLDKLLAHPLLEDGQTLDDCEAVLVSLIGGPDLTMAEINRIMQEIKSKCDGAQIMMGAAIDELFRERLAVTLVAVRKSAEQEPSSTSRTRSEEFGSQLLKEQSASRPASRFIPPPPALAPDQMQKMLAQQGNRVSRVRKGLPKLRQTQLPLEIVSKGRFDKSEPTIHKGEDLDVPTYIRRGVALN